MKSPRRGRKTRKVSHLRRFLSPTWRKRLLIGGLPAVLVAGMCGSGWWLWHSGTVDRWTQSARDFAIGVSVDAGFKVDEILVVGRDLTRREDLLRAVGLRRGSAMFGFDPDEVKERVEALTWVREASVERRLPGKVLLRIVERQPLALWQRDGAFDLIDNRGEVIHEPDFRRFGNLLVVAGTDAPGHAPELLKMLKGEPELLERVKAAVRVGGRRWNVYLDNGVSVQLPEEGSAAAWTKLAEIEKSQHILSRDVQVLDLRFPDRLIVSTTPGKESLPKVGGQET